MGFALILYIYGPIALVGLAISLFGVTWYGKSADREAQASGRVLTYPLPDNVSKATAERLAGG